MNDDMNAPNNNIVHKKQDLTQYLYEIGALWSYKINSDTVLPDRELIAKSLTYLELEDMWMLWDIYSEEYIRKVWEEDMLPQNEAYMGITNRIVAYVLFHVKDYETYKIQVCGRLD